MSMLMVICRDRGQLMSGVQINGQTRSSLIARCASSVDRALRLQRAGLKQTRDAGRAPWAEIQVGMEGLGDDAGQPVELEAATRIAEAARAFVPKGASEGRQLRAQDAAIEPLEARMKRAPKDGAEVLELKPADARELHLPQRVLPRIRKSVPEGGLRLRRHAVAASGAGQSQQGSGAW
jgi:hypothetical protein